MSQIIIITDTEEPGAFESATSMAVLNLDTDFVNRMKWLSSELESNHDDFSELRLWGSYAEYYANVTPDHLLDALLKIAEADPSKIEPEKVEEIRALYYDNGSFKWPDGIELNLRELVNSTAADFGEEASNEPIESMSVDIEEVVVELGDFRCAAYLGDQQIYSKNIPYSWALDEAAI
jgi:hypothetical protein